MDFFVDFVGHPAHATLCWMRLCCLIFTSFYWIIISLVRWPRKNADMSFCRLSFVTQALWHGVLYCIRIYPLDTHLFASCCRFSSSILTYALASILLSTPIGLHTPKKPKIINTIILSRHIVCEEYLGFALLSTHWHLVERFFVCKQYLLQKFFSYPHPI